MRCGKQAMEASRTHYDGPDEAKKRLSEAKARLKTIFYRHEATFSFEKYVTALNDIYLIHERYNEPIYETDKVENLLDKCQNNHPEFKQEIVMCRSTKHTFKDAVTHLKIVVARLFPDGGKGGSYKRKIASLGKEGGNRKKVINGVDVSDLTRWYQNWELKKLPRGLVKKIMTNKDHQSKNKDQIDKIKRAKVATVDSKKEHKSDGTVLSEDQNRMVAAVINGVANASRHSEITFPQNGRSASVSAASRGNVSRPAQPSDNISIVSFDHLGNPMS